MMLPKNKQRKTIKRNLNLNERAVDIILEIIKVFEQMLEITKAKIHCALKKQLFYALIDSSTAITANQPLEERKEKKGQHYEIISRRSGLHKWCFGASCQPGV